MLYYKPRTSDGFVLSQSHYIKKMLENFDKCNNCLAKTPIDPNVHMFKNIGKGISQLEYYRTIGILMYIMNCNHPDIAYYVSKLSRYTSNPRERHSKAIISQLLSNRVISIDCVKSKGNLADPLTKG